MISAFALVAALTSPVSSTHETPGPSWELSKHGDSSMISVKSDEGVLLTYACDKVGCGWALLLGPKSCSEGDMIQMEMSSSKGAKTVSAKCKLSDEEMSSLAIQEYEDATRLVSGSQRVTFSTPNTAGSNALNFNTGGFNSARAKMGR